MVLEYRSAANLAITLKDDDITPAKTSTFWDVPNVATGHAPGRTTLCISGASIRARIFCVSFASECTRSWSCGSILLVTITPQMDSSLLRLCSAEYAPTPKNPSVALELGCRITLSSRGLRIANLISEWPDRFGMSENSCSHPYL